MANTLGADIPIHAQDPKKAAFFYVKQLGFEKDPFGLIYNLTA